MTSASVFEKVWTLANVFTRVYTHVYAHVYTCMSTDQKAKRTLFVNDVADGWVADDVVELSPCRLRTNKERYDRCILVPIMTYQLSTMLVDSSS